MRLNGVSTTLFATLLVSILIRPQPVTSFARTRSTIITRFDSMVITKMMTTRKPPTETDPLIIRSSSTLLQVQSGGDSNDNETRSTSSLSIADDNNKQTTTTGQRILDLAIPAGAALLIDPLMTLADTSFVGRFSDTPDQLAGMGSSVPILTFSFYICNFLCTATTPLVAEKRAAGLTKEAVKVGGQALSLALVLGAILTVIIFSFKQTLLTVMGTGNTGSIANDYALSFLSIRALAAPAVLCIEASTGVLRGYLDTKTPIVVLIIANILNLVLDVILIAYAGLGPVGAAIATTTAEWISAGLFLGVLAGRLPSASAELGSSRESTTSSNDDEGEEAIKVAVVPLSIPSWRDIRPLVVASSSVFFRTFVLQISLSGAAAMAARSGDNAAPAVAAHQIGLQLWLLCSFFCDSLAAASQGLVADSLGRNDPDSARDVSKTVFSYSLALGLFLAAVLQVGVSTGFLFDIFTEDASIRTSLGEILPLIVVAQPLNALVFAADGILQGASEFPYQARAMVLSGLTAVCTFLALQVGLADSDTLVHVWSAIIALQAMRGLTSVWKLIERDGPIDLLASKP